MIATTSAMFVTLALGWLVLNWFSYRSASRGQRMSVRMGHALIWVIVIGGLTIAIDRFSA